MRNLFRRKPSGAATKSASLPADQRPNEVARRASDAIHIEDERALRAMNRARFGGTIFNATEEIQPPTMGPLQIGDTHNHNFNPQQYPGGNTTGGDPAVRAVMGVLMVLGGLAASALTGYNLAEPGEESVPPEYENILDVEAINPDG